MWRDREIKVCRKSGKLNNQLTNEIYWLTARTIQNTMLYCGNSQIKEVPY